MGRFLRARVVAAVAALSVSAFVSAPSTAMADGAQALMVVGGINPSGLAPSKDRPVVALLESLGFDVELVDDDVVTLADVDGNDVVVVSSSVVPSKIGTMFRDVATPVVTWEGYLFDDFGFTAGSNGETGTTQSSLTIVDDSHPLSAGYSGAPAVSTVATKFSYARPVASAQVVGRVGSAAVLFGFDSAGSPAGGVAPARRVGLFMNYSTAGSLTQVGRDMVAAAMGWATDTVTVTTNDAPTVSAGPDMSITMPTDTVTFNGTVTDDGVPVPPNVTIGWAQFSGPPGVTFSAQAEAVTAATFPMAGQYVLQLTADDGEKSASDHVTINVDAELPAGINVAYVASRLALPSGDRPIRDRLVANGATVTVVDDDALLATYDQFDLIFLSTSVVYSKVGDHFADVSQPLITTEQYLLDDMNMASPSIGVRNATTIRIQAPGHELAASTTGNVAINTTATGLGFGQPGPGATIVATVSGQPVYFAYRTGDSMVGGIEAPARRVAFPGAYTTANGATRAYFDLLDAAVAYALTNDDRAPVAVDDSYQTNDDSILNVAADIVVAEFGSQGVAPGQFWYPNGVSIAADRQLVITDTANHRIQTCSPEGANCVAFGGFSDDGELGRFDTPTGVAVAADGRLVIVEAYFNRIQTCDPDGTDCTTFGRLGSGLGQFDGPSDVAVTADGKVLIADAGNDRIQTCDRDGANCTAFGSPGTAPGQFNLPRGVAVTVDGGLVIADTGSDRIQTCDGDGSNCTAFGSTGTAPGQFNDPQSVAVAADGRLVIADTGNNRIQICRPDGSNCTAFGNAGSALGQFDNPLGVAITDDGRFVVVDAGNHRIQVISPGGVLVNDSDPDGDLFTLTAFDATSANGAVVNVNSDGSFSYDPTGAPAIQSLGDGATLADTFTYSISDGEFTTTATVTVTVTANHAPVAVDDSYQTNEDRVLDVAANTVVTFLSSQGTAPGQFDGPFGVAVDANGRLVIADTGNDRIQTCDPDGTGCSVFGSQGTAPGQFNSPIDVAIDADGRLVIADNGNARIQICDPDGTDCTVFGIFGSGLGQFDGLVGASIDADGRLVIADTANDRIQTCDPDGTNCASFGSSGSALGQFYGPYGVAINGDGRLVITDQGNSRVQTCNPDGTGCTSFGSLGPASGQFNFVAGVAVAADGTLFIADVGNHRIQACDPDGSNCTTFGFPGAFPYDVAIGADGTIVMIDSAYGGIQVIKPGGVLVNDRDSDGDPLTVTAFDDLSANGAVVTVNANGSFTYDPTGAAAIQALDVRETLSDTFTYSVSDGEYTVVATVTVTVTGV